VIVVRKKRIWYPGAVYHIVSRGNRKCQLFRDKRDYDYYLDILRKVKEKFDFSLLAYCLMTNHIHLQIKTKDVEIWRLMQRINLFYAKYFNYKYDLVGHLFQGRYFSKIIEDNLYNLGVNRYIHLNPVAASIVTKAELYRQSSYPVYLGLKNNKLIDQDIILSYFENNRKLYRKFIESEVINKKLDQEIRDECEW
jgi:REP element-mobilizing transposase RayT